MTDSDGVTESVATQLSFSFQAVYTSKDTGTVLHVCEC